MRFSFILLKAPWERMEVGGKEQYGLWYRMFRVGSENEIGVAKEDNTQPFR